MKKSPKVLTASQEEKINGALSSVEAAVARIEELHSPQMFESAKRTRLVILDLWASLDEMGAVLQRERTKRLYERLLATILTRLETALATIEKDMSLLMVDGADRLRVMTFEIWQNIGGDDVAGRSLEDRALAIFQRTSTVLMSLRSERNRLSAEDIEMALGEYRPTETETYPHLKLVHSTSWK